MFTQKEFKELYGVTQDELKSMNRIMFGGEGLPPKPQGKVERMQSGFLLFTLHFSGLGRASDRIYIIDGHQVRRYS